MTGFLAAVSTLLRADGRSGIVSWDQLLIHRNNAPAPSPEPGADSMWNRGFDFLVLASGQPTHFGRCRSAGDARVRRASHIRSRLSEDPALHTLVPMTRFMLADPLLVEISRYARGTSLLHDVARLGADRLTADSRRALAACRTVTSAAELCLPELRPSAPHVRLRDAAEPALRYCASAGLAADHVAALDRALVAAGEVPARLQHGDLWPANVLRSAAGFVILDYEVFGDVHVPLFDVFHFLRSCVMQRAAASRGERDLLTILEEGGPGARYWRDIVREEAARDGLAPAQQLGAFAYYLTDMTATIRRRDGPAAYWGPYWRCLEALADRLAPGRPLVDLLSGDGRR